MPELDGISALPQLLAKKRNLIIIMASTLTRRNAEISFKALSLGAADYIPKPESTREIAAAEIFQHDLIQKIRTSAPNVVRRGAPASPAARRWRPRERAPTRRARVAAAQPSRADAASPFSAHVAARAADRLVDRRPAGADDAGAPRSGR